ncbi:MAG: SOUL family heme-binding protein [Pseudomonadota bacterium]
MAVEEPKYEVLESFGDVEIRQYPPLVIAETVVEGDFGSAGNEGFRRAAGYIFGGNQQKQKISMTAPVLQEEKAGKKHVSFVMPQEKKLSNLPMPDDSRVVLKEVSKRKMAALKYSGTWSEERYQEKVKELFDQLRNKNIKAKGEPVLARYNPPWIPWFLRRNEILIEIE